MITQLMSSELQTTNQNVPEYLSHPPPFQLSYLLLFPFPALATLKPPAAGLAPPGAPQVKEI